MPIRAVLACFFGLSCITISQRLAFARYYVNDIQHISTDLVKILYWGLRFDVAVAAFLTLCVSLLVYFATRFTSAAYIDSFRQLSGLCATLLLCLFAVDGAYYSLYLQHADASVFANMGTVIDLSLDWLFGHWPLFLVQMGTLILFVAYFYRVYSPKDSAETAQGAAFTIRYRWWPELRLALVVLACLVLVRGGWQSTPLKPIHAHSIGDKHLYPYTLNGAYHLLYSIFKDARPAPSLLPLDPKRALDYVTILQTNNKPDPKRDKASDAAAVFRPQNVIFILLNSWSTRYLASYGFEKPSTPYFDQLHAQSLSAQTMLAGSERPEEHLFAVYCATQAPLGRKIADSQLHQYQFQCLPDLLRQNGYSTMFIQAGSRYSGDLSSIAHYVGFEQNRSLKDIERRQYKLNPSGVHDPDLYQFALRQMDMLAPPFAVAIHTNSTRHKQLPSNWVGEFPVHEERDEKLNILNFADYALQNFIEELQQKPYYSNSLLVLLGDRASTDGLSMAHAKGPMLQHFSVPFAINASRQLRARIIDGVAGPRDITPTVLAILGLPIPTHYVGQNLLRPGKPHLFADYYGNGRLGWVESSAIVEFPLRDPGQLKCYTYRANAAPKEMACKPQATRSVNRALGFTAISQKLLNQGQLEQFASIKKLESGR